MPVRIKQAAAPSSGRVRVNFDNVAPPEPQTEEPSLMDDILSPAGLAGIAALVGTGAIALRNKGALGKILENANAVRQQLMLSGLAIPKTILGNVGGAAIASAEQRSMKPLSELLSSTTLKEIVAEYRAGAPTHMAASAASGKAMHGPGRVLGAMDNATKSAFARAGLTAEQSDRLTFQTPLNKWAGELGDTLDSPAMRYLMPFRRTPFNALREGALTLKPSNLKDPVQKALLAGSVAVGGAHGYATADDDHPMSIGLGAAASHRYALPYLLSAAGGRALAGGTDPESMAGEALPISEYGLASGITHPTAPFTNPAAVRVLRRLLEN